MKNSQGYEPVHFLTLEPADLIAVELSATVARDQDGRVGAVLTYNQRGQRATLLGWRPYVDVLAKTATGRVETCQVLAHLALGWPEDWVTEAGVLTVKPKRVHREARPKLVTPEPDPWVAELLALLDTTTANA